MSLMAEFLSPLENVTETASGLRVHAREMAEIIEATPGPGDPQPKSGTYPNPGRGVSGESSN